MVFLYCEGQESLGGNERQVWFWKCLDLDGYMRGHEADGVLVGRLTNAHSKKVENHRHALALYFMYYNFARIHSSLRVTPAMQAGVANHVWSIDEMLQLLDYEGKG